MEGLETVDFPSNPVPAAACQFVHAQFQRRKRKGTNANVFPLISAPEQLSCGSSIETLDGAVDANNDSL